MIPLPQGVFELFALALPRGLGFGDDLPIEAWQAEDSSAFAVLTRHVETGQHRLLVRRRRADRVWATIAHEMVESQEAALALASTLLVSGAPAAPRPSGVPRRPPLFALKGQPSRMLQLLANESHRNAAFVLHELYLAMPRPDANWASDLRGENFHTRLWEAQLLASLREQGLQVTQPHENPDFRIENRQGLQAWIEAVTANPPERFEHVGAPPQLQPEDLDELFFGNAAVRFAKTIGNKLDRLYTDLEHVAGQPFALALADFHAPSSMVWSREALLGYLYATGPRTNVVDGHRTAVVKEVTHLLGASNFPAGLFCNRDHAELSAIIFTNACTTGKFNRMALSMGAPTPGLRYTRYGKFFDRTPGALDGIPFCLNVRDPAYLALWPHGAEPWCAELEVFHNPFAKHPLPRGLMPEAAHWVMQDGELVCQPHYETAILWSKTLIQKDDAPVPTYETIPQILADLARGHANEVGRPAGA